MENSKAFCFGFYVCLMLLVFASILVFDAYDLSPQGTSGLITQCELNLPRTQTCELVAVPKEVEGE